MAVSLQRNDEEMLVVLSKGMKQKQSTNETIIEVEELFQSLDFQLLLHYFEEKDLPIEDLMLWDLELLFDPLQRLVIEIAIESMKE